MSTHSKITTMPFFDKSTTNIIKGVALIMMLVHHLFTFPHYWIDGINYPLLAEVSGFFQNQLKICVPVFCFLTGYFYCFCKTKTYKYSFKKITDFLINYWILFIVFGLLAVFIAGYRYSFSDIVLEAFGILRPTMYFCWYVYFYCIALLLLPLVSKIMGKKIYIDLFIAIVLVQYPFNHLANFFDSSFWAFEIFKSISSWIPVLLMGYVFAQYELYSKLDKIFSKYFVSKVSDFILSLVLVIVFPILRWYEPVCALVFQKIPQVNMTLDVVYVPFFVFGIIRLSRIITEKHIHFVVSKIGEKSLLMWFTSCIFYGNMKEYFQPVLYFPKNPVLVTIWGLILTYLMAVAFDFVIKKIVAAKNKVFFK